MFLKTLLVMVMTLMLPINGEDGTCKEPDMSKLLVDINELHDSFYLLPNMQNHIVNASSTSEFVAIRHGYLHGPKKCPSFQALIDYNGGQLCPVYYVHNYDENRIPKSLMEARCSCKVPPLGNSFKDKLIYECAPLMYYTKVQRRVRCDQNGYYVYTTAWDQIQIGCFTKIPIRSQSPPPRPVER